MLDSSTGLAEMRTELALSNEQLEAVTRDPASFALTFLITSKDEWLLNELYRKVPEQLHDLLDSLLTHYSSSGLVVVAGEKVVRQKRQIEMFGDSRQSRFIPKTFEIASRQLLEKPFSEYKENRERIKYFVFPNSPEVAEELDAITSEFFAKVNALRLRTREAVANSDEHRFVGLVSYRMELEDFV